MVVKKPPRQLTDLDADEVSLVDAGANRQRFLIVKRIGGNAVEKKGTTSLGVVITKLKSAIEKQVALAKDLEGEQEPVDGSGADSASEESGEDALQAKVQDGIVKVIGELEAIIKNPTPEDSNKEETVMGGKESGMEVPEVLTKALGDITDGLKELREDVGVLKKAKEDAEAEAATTAKAEEEKVAKEKADADEKEKLAKAKEGDESLLDKVQKALDERSTKIVGSFQEVAKEEFGPVFKRLDAIEKAMTGDTTGSGDGSDDTPEGGKGEDVETTPRTFGHEESDFDISNKDNPFHSTFVTMKDF